MALHYIKVKEVAAHELAEGDILWAQQHGWVKVAGVDSEFGMVDVKTKDQDGNNRGTIGFEYDKDELVLIKDKDQS